MSDIQHYLIEAGKNKDEARKVAEDVAGRLERKEIQLLAIVESVGEYINNEDATLRTHSLAYLADILECLPPRILSLQQRALLTDFILSRIQDDTQGGITPCARALLALENLGKWTSDTATNILSTLMDSTHPLKDLKLQGERYTVLQLIDLLLARYRESINQRAEGDFDFIAKFVTYFEGEKDPRNLMIVFSIVMVPMTEWSLGPSTQDMFDLVFNYFPITFKPPPGDPFKITAQDLKDRLKTCIASTSDFAPYSFSALLDKLDSSSMNTKRDVLQAIIACISHYEPRTISLYSVTLWDALKFEILNVQEDDLAESSLEALALTARQLQLASEGALNAYLKPIVKECNEHLEDAPTKQSEAAGKILKSIIGASPDVADYLVKGVVPSMLTLFQASESITKRRGLIEVLNKMLQAIDTVSSQWQTRDGDGIIINDHASSHALRSFTQDLVGILLQAVVSAPKTEISFRLCSLQGLVHMLEIRQLLAEPDTERILEAATDIVVHEAHSSSDEIKSAAIETIIAAARQYPKTAVEKALPALVAQLPDCPEQGIFTYEPALEVLAKLSVEPQLADTIIIRLKHKLNAAKRQSAPRTYMLGLLGAFLFIFTNGSPARENGALRLEYLNDLALPWLEEAIGLATAENPLLSSEINVDILGRICNIIIREQNLHTQNQVFTAVERLFDSLNATQPTPEAESEGKPGSKLGVIASLYFHSAFRREIYQEEVPVKLLKSLFDIVGQNGNTRMVKASALRHIAVIVNKFLPAPLLESTLTDIDPELVYPSNQSSISQVEIALAVGQGLIVQGKNAKLASKLVDTYLQLLNSQSCGHIAAIGLSRLLSSDDLLSKQNHSVISGLYKQRIYNQCYHSIASGTKSASPEAKKNFLVALSGMLKSLSYDIVQPSLPIITPLLLQTLDLKEPANQRMKASALVTIEAILLYDSALLEEHASSIITRLLGNTEPAQNHEDVRIAALRCLKLLPSQAKRETVIPYRRQVINKLLACLDDRRRAVRAEAVRSRSAWIALDQDDED